MIRRRWLIAVLVISIMLIASINTLGMISSNDRQDQYAKNYGFKVEITDASGDTIEGNWKSVRHSGIRIIESPGTTTGPEKAPGKLDAGDIEWGDLILSGPVLKKSQREGLLDWYGDIVESDEGPDAYRDVKITIRQPDEDDMHTYDFYECFLSSYTMTPLDSDDDSELEETIVISIGHVDEYPVKERKNNKGSFVSSVAHGLNHPIGAENDLDEFELPPLRSGFFTFDIDGDELGVSSVGVGTINFEYDAVNGLVEPVYENWILEKPFEEGGFNLEDIYNDFLSGVRTPDTSSGSLELLDKTNKTARRFDFSGPFPVRYETATFTASDGSTTLIETLELAHEGLELG